MVFDVTCFLVAAGTMLAMMKLMVLLVFSAALEMEESNRLVASASRETIDEPVYLSWRDLLVLTKSLRSLFYPFLKKRGAPGAMMVCGKLTAALGIFVRPRRPLLNALAADLVPLRVVFLPPSTSWTWYADGNHSIAQAFCFLEYCETSQRLMFVERNPPVAATIQWTVIPAPKPIDIFLSEIPSANKTCVK